MKLIGNDPVFESSLLLAGDTDPRYVRLQLSRWVKNGRIYQLRRGLYTIAPPFQKVQPHPFVIANHLQRASYVSLQSALAYYGMIPETVNITTSVTAGRPERLATPVGIFEFRHIQTRLLTGYRMVDLGDQEALVATPEKALLDLVYLQPDSAFAAYLRELRLQNLERINLDVLAEQSQIFDTPKMRLAVKRIMELVQAETYVYEEL